MGKKKENFILSTYHPFPLISSFIRTEIFIFTISRSFLDIPTIGIHVEQEMNLKWLCSNYMIRYVTNLIWPKIIWINSFVGFSTKLALCRHAIFIIYPLTQPTMLLFCYSFKLSFVDSSYPSVWWFCASQQEFGMICLFFQFSTREKEKDWHKIWWKSFIIFASKTEIFYFFSHQPLQQLRATSTVTVLFFSWNVCNMFITHWNCTENWSVDMLLYTDDALVKWKKRRC